MPPSQISFFSAEIQRRFPISTAKGVNQLSVFFLYRNSLKLESGWITLDRVMLHKVALGKVR